jgi:hypothetical protein
MTTVIFVDWLDDFCHLSPMFIRRLGVNAASSPLPCSGGRSCPDVLELADGDFAIIGADITQYADLLNAVGAGCGPGEKMVRIPRALLVRVRADIPEAA